MSYTINFYSNNEETIVVNKTLSATPPLTLTANMKYGLDLLKPILIVSTTLSEVSQYNYVYIPELSRYYYVVGYKGVSNVLVEITLECDLLMSWKDEFILSDCTIERNETRGNVYVSDSLYPIECRTQTVTKKFPNALSNTATMFLITIG